eukprot:TRINITY_DN1557_c0_g1_i2.p1 TRINITY_DN1557_c0_g1~~TRINITY_DN1557_c0_g1_i2.p1  ORF type:complete len:185 (+),score=51.17 TRINITY_DN1557_c0_g1_i2:151-705(+)
MVKSKSMPFMEAPAALDGTMAGDVGFDPLYFTNVFDIKWMREAELKHCRITMLATLGFLVQELFTLPARYFPSRHHCRRRPRLLCQDWRHAAAAAVVLLCRRSLRLLGILYTYERRRPCAGDFAFDPLKLANTPAKRAQMELSEVKNGRLAMIAIGGMVHQEWYSHKPVLDLFAHPAPILNISM